VSNGMWSVNIEASLFGENQTMEGIPAGLWRNCDL
jgi:hypothetical protein